MKVFEMDSYLLAFDLHSSLETGKPQLGCVLQEELGKRKLSR